jgi:hypothetical protein
MNVLYLYIFFFYLIKDFLRKLCKDGFPSGNIYEYAAQMVCNFERKKKAAK